jgi:hypothetical protein
MLSRFGINDGDILIPFNSEGDFLANMKIKTGDGGKFILSQTEMCYLHWRDYCFTATTGDYEGIEELTCQLYDSLLVGECKGLKCRVFRREVVGLDVCGRN